MSDDARNPIRTPTRAQEAGVSALPQGLSAVPHVRSAVTLRPQPAPPPPRTGDPPPPSDEPPPASGGPPEPPGGPPNRGRRRWRRGGSGDGGGSARPRLRKLRFFLLLAGLAALALVSTVFGMMMAVASDIPLIENQQEYKTLGKNSYLYDDHWRPIGIFAAPNPEVIDQWKDLSQPAIHAVLAVEDKRFWSDPGVDLRGIVRAVYSDVGGGPTQGASTITEQFVKNALQQQGNRTVFEKLREAALAFHLTRKWKPTKILTQYLNSVYFGNGAYGIESAARVYFGKSLGYDPTAATDEGISTCGDRTTRLPSCASKLNYWQAALLAGLIANPSAWDPIANPHDARVRRNLVLRDMLEQHYISPRQYETGINEPLPTEADLQQPSEPAAAPYFTSWLRPQILSAVGYRPTESPQKQATTQYRAYYGGLKIRTTLDLKMQQAADQAISATLPYDGPNSPVASLVTIDNRTGEVRAMVGGPNVNGAEDYGKYPFNLATEAQRQPGSAFKPFTLAVALESGFGPDSVLLSAPADFIVPNSGGKEAFHVRNFGNTYSGPISLQTATDYSDNSVFSRLGIEGLGPNGPKRIAAMAAKAGIRTPVSHNYAMILGGLKVGVSPLDMAHAYETFADGGKRVYNLKLGSPDEGPTGIAEIQYPKGSIVKDVPSFRRVMPAAIAQEVHDMLAGVVQSGTGTAAAISGTDVVGKTGTTTNYADAWFVGWTPQLTTAVWVGFPNKLVPMTTLFNGGPVEGGTYPAVIWHDYMTQALQILASEQPASNNTSTTSTTSTVQSAPSTTGGSSGGPSTTSAPSTGGSTTGGGKTPPAAGGPAGGGGTAGGGGSAGGGGGTTGGGGGTTGGGGGGTTGGGGGGTAGGGGGTTGGGGGSGGGSGGAGIGAGR